MVHGKFSNLFLHLSTSPYCTTNQAGATNMGMPKCDLKRTMMIFPILFRSANIPLHNFWPNMFHILTPLYVEILGVLASILSHALGPPTTNEHFISKKKIHY